VSTLTGERAAQIRRNTRLLALAQACVQVAFPIFLIVAGPAAKDLTGNASALGLLSGCYFVAAAAGAAVVGRWMDRAGRRPGLMLAAVLTAGSAILCGVAITFGSFPLLLLASVPFGVGNGAANLARGAIADMYEPAHRGRAVGVLLAAGTVGAVGSPLLLIAVRAATDGTAVDGNVAACIVVGIAVIGARGRFARVRAVSVPGPERSPL